MVQEGVDDRAGSIRVGRVYDHSGGLVDDQQIVVLEGNIQRDGLREYLHRGRLHQSAFNTVTRLHDVGCFFDQSSIDGDPALFDGLLDLGPCGVLDTRSQIDIQAGIVAVSRRHGESDGYLLLFGLGHGQPLKGNRNESHTGACYGVRPLKPTGSA